MELRPPDSLDLTESTGRSAAHRRGRLRVYATLVVVGCGDEHASCVGAGAINPGVVVDVMGTAEPVCAPALEPVYDESQLVETHCHAHPERWLLENPGFVSGGSHRWFRDNFYSAPGGTGAVTYDDLNQEAETTPAGSEGVIFLPCMMGAMAPERREEMVGLGFKSILAGTMATCMTGAIVGLLR